MLVILSGMEFNHPIYQRFRGRLLHVTNLIGLRGICKMEAILPNVTNRFEHGPWNDCECLCRNLGGISLLDLRNPDEEKLFHPDHSHSGWDQVFSYHSPYPSIVLEIDEVQVSHQLHRPTDQEAKEYGGFFVWIAEICARDRIPKKAIRSGVVIKTTESGLAIEKGATCLASLIPVVEEIEQAVETPVNQLDKVASELGIRFM